MSWSTRPWRPRRMRAVVRALVVLIGVSTASPAQRVDRVDVPRLLVSGWLENDSLSREAAELVAADLKRLIPYPGLLVASGQEMEHQLSGHWYRTAGPMTTADLRLVGRLMRADVIVDVATRRTKAGIEFVPRRMRADAASMDTLPAVTALSDREAAARLARWLSAKESLLGVKP